MCVQTKNIGITVTAASAASPAFDGGGLSDLARLPGARATTGVSVALRGDTKVGSAPTGWTEEVVIPESPENIFGLPTASDVVLVNTSGVTATGGRPDLARPMLPACATDSASFSCPSNHEVMI